MAIHMDIMDTMAEDLAQVCALCVYVPDKMWKSPNLRLHRSLR